MKNYHITITLVCSMILSSCTTSHVKDDAKDIYDDCSTSTIQNVLGNTNWNNFTFSNISLSCKIKSW